MEQFKQMQGAEFLDDDKIWRNDKYQVNVKFLSKRKENGWVWLSIKRTDKEAIHDWRELQQIKNILCGDEREGVELYPSEKRLVDTSNQFHIFVMPNGEKFPFGYGGRLIVEGHNDFVPGKGGSKQRPFEESPKDVMAFKEIEKLKEKYMQEVKENK